MRSALLAALLWSSWAAAAAPKTAPAEASCTPLPAALVRRAFAPGEVLEFDLDAMGAQAGTMTMRVLQQKNGSLPVEVRAQTNTFFSKVRRVTGTATSYLNPKTLRPVRYTEDTVENEVTKTAEVSFTPQKRKAQLRFTIGKRGGRRELSYEHDGLDVAGAIYLMRQLPLKAGRSLCFDVYGIRQMWRLTGKVEGKEPVSLKLGEFKAWHLSGVAVRRDNPAQRREVHVWISDDDRRLPLAALGSIDLGAVRATLTGFQQPGKKAVRPSGAESLKW